MVLKILDTVIVDGRVQLSPLLTLPLYILHSLSILFTLHSLFAFPFYTLYSIQFSSTSSLLPLSTYIPSTLFLSPISTLYLHFLKWLAPLWHSHSTLTPFLHSFLNLEPISTLYLHLLIWLLPLWHSHSIFPFYPPYLFAYHKKLLWSCSSIAIRLPTGHTRTCPYE